MWFSELFFLADSVEKVKLLADRKKRESVSEAILSNVDLLTFPLLLLTLTSAKLLQRYRTSEN